MTNRFAQLKIDLARRIAPILRDVPTLLFEELVNVIATMQYERESMRSTEVSSETADAESEVTGGALPGCPGNMPPTRS